MYSKMRRRMLRLAIILLIAEILFVGVFCCGRWGWKLLGFWGCEGARLETVTVEDGQVRLQGTDPGIPPEGCLGYLYEEDNGKLYVGLRFDGLFGILENGAFDFTIPVEGEITEVYLKTATEDYLIWSAEDGLIAEE